MYDPKVIKLTGSLSVSLETDDFADAPDPELYPMFLFVPDPYQDDHWHIPLNREKAILLRDWLNEYLTP